MVNIPMIAMDDFGILEPTDVGTMTVDYDPKEDSKKKQRWEQDETVYMLQLIKENNLHNRYSMTKMANILSELMLKKGYHRTDKQISQKLMGLRKNFSNYQQLKLNTHSSYIKECPFYKELYDIYSKMKTNNDDNEDFESDIRDSYLMKFPNDNVGWQKCEVQKMLNSIKAMKLKTELTLTFFSPMAVKMIAEALQSAGYKRSAEQVKNALINLRTMYVDYKIACDRNEDPQECVFFPMLDAFWSKEYRKCRLKEKRSLVKTDDSWSVEETIFLLNLIKDLDIAEEAYKNTNKAAEELRTGLAENGYSRTAQHVMTKLSQLKTDFLSVHRHYADSDAVHQFHFYKLYKKLFEHQFSQDLSVDSRKNTLDYLGFGGKTEDSPQKANKAVYWTKDEVKLLLKTVRDLTSKSNCLEDEKLQRLKEVLKEAGYRKTAEQIKHKLALLKNSYVKCNSNDSSERDIFECPFYNELHDIFHTPVSDERYEFIQSLLSENLDLDELQFSDHSYTNTKFGNSSGESRSNDKVTVIPNKCLDNWFPVESIIEDDDDIGASSTLNFNDLSDVSNKEQEQVIEDAFLATLTNNSDTKIEINPVIPDTIFSDSKSVSLDDKIPSIIDVDDHALDAEVTAVNQEPQYPKSFTYHPPEPEDADSRSSSVATTKRASSLDDEGQPPLKKPRIIEDEKVGSKNKFLLRPVDSMNPSSLNVTNTKFVRLIVANEPNKNPVNHITAHIEPLNVNTANSVSSGMSSPVDRADILKIATERALSKDDFDLHSEPDVLKKVDGNIDLKISETITEAVQTMMKNDELLQQKHHSWMEKQFEIQRKHDEAQNNVIVNELKQLRNLMTVLIDNKAFDMNKQSQ